MNEPAISIVIPCFNAAATIGQQLDALSTQSTDVTFEVVVVDNASTDDSASCISRRSEADHRIRYVSATNAQGPSHARNAGIEAALAPLIACCDADDVVDVGWIDAMYRALAAHEFVAGVLSVEKLNRPEVVAARGTSIPGSAGDFLGVAFAHGCNLGIRRDTYLSIGGLAERLRAGEEIDLAIRLRSRGVFVHEARDAIVNYRFRDDVKGQWNQAFEGGRVKPHLCKALRLAHISKPSRGAGLKNWLWLLRTIPRLHDEAIRLRWQWVLASRCGQIAGCWRYKTVYL